MASIIDTQLRKIVADAFKGKLLRGTLRREVATTVDSAGDPVPATPTSYPFEGIRDSFNAAFAARAGIPLTDVKILIIAGSCLTDPRQDDKIFIRDRWHQVKAILEIDPARATYTLQCYEINTPT